MISSIGWYVSYIKANNVFSDVTRCYKMLHVTETITKLYGVNYRNNSLPVFYDLSFTD